MTKWEYTQRRIHIARPLTENLGRLNQLGEEGWEVCGTVLDGAGIVYTLKRPIREEGE